MGQENSLPNGDRDDAPEIQVFRCPVCRSVYMALGEPQQVLDGLVDFLLSHQASHGSKK